MLERVEAKFPSVGQDSCGRGGKKRMMSRGPHPDHWPQKHQWAVGMIEDQLSMGHMTVKQTVCLSQTLCVTAHVWEHSL